MSQARRKMQRIDPLIKAKKSIMESEATVLSEIRRKKVELVAKMKEYQRLYMQGIEKLNKERGSANRTNLLTLEENLDYVKDQWHDFFLAVRKTEAQEKAQLAELERAQRSLKSFEKLQDNYLELFVAEQKKVEQKLTDETSIRRFTTQKQPL